MLAGCRAAEHRDKEYQQMKPGTSLSAVAGPPAFKDMSHFPSMASRAVPGQDLRELSSTTTARKAFLPQVSRQIFILTL